MKVIDKLDKILTRLIYIGFVLITLFYFLLVKSAEMSAMKYIITGFLITLAVFIFISMEEK